MNKSARINQKGFVASPPMIIGGIIVLVVIVLLVAGGNFKFSAKLNPTGQKQTATSDTTSSKETVEETSAPTPTPAPESTSTFKTFTSEEMNLSFEYPEDWKINEASDAVTISLMEEGKTNNAAAAISAVSKPLGSAKGFQFASIVDMQRVALKKEFSVQDFTVDNETKVGDNEARILEFQGTISGNSLTGKYLTTADKENIYAITVLADTDKWSKYSGDLQKTLDSFKVLK
ncbi:hypothetical protein HYU95_04510 [Candidatus Daviesbacteria bacterium]|nr:hypothetical protein [Candidatus Daviesbacteria bacterium]